MRERETRDLSVRVSGHFGHGSFRLSLSAPEEGICFTVIRVRRCLGSPVNKLNTDDGLMGLQTVKAGFSLY